MDYLIVLGLAAIPGLANLTGGLLARAIRVSDPGIAIALHSAVGIVLAVVALVWLMTGLF